MRDRSSRFGPFTGRQLTTIICVGMVMVLFPVGAWAVSGSNVFVTDAASGTTAKISTSGALTVAGSVTANTASPKNLYVNFSSPSGTYSPAATPPSGKALVVTSIAVDAELSPTPGIVSYTNFLISSTDATCATTVAGSVGVVSPSGIGMTTIPIPTGLVIPANRSLCEYADTSAWVVVYGYLVSATSAPTGMTTSGHPNALPAGIKS